MLNGEYKYFFDQEELTEYAKTLSESGWYIASEKFVGEGYYYIFVSEYQCVKYVHVYTVQQWYDKLEDVLNTAGEILDGDVDD